MERLVYAVALSEFDQKKGNTLALQHPAGLLTPFNEDRLADLCLPDGAHIHTEDWTYAIMEEPDTNPPRYLYVIALFRNIVDPSQPRGAMQKSLLIASHMPYFSLFEPLVRTTLHQVMTVGQPKAPIELYETINAQFKQSLHLTLWGDKFPINLPVLAEDEFAGVSLIDLVRIFQVNTMLIWYSLLLEDRLLFCGQPARTVGSCCLACPLLVAPLHGYTKLITPYVTLTDLTPLMATHFICGTTNMLIETKAEFYDTIGNVSSASVHSATPIKVSSQDKAFIKDVISGIEDKKGESWVREQFRRYTERFLTGLLDGKLKVDFHRKTLSKFKDSPLFTRYCKEKAEKVVEAPTETALDYLKKLQAPESELGVLDRPKMYYFLDKTLVNLPDIEEYIEAGGIDVVLPGLKAEGAQVRKYAVCVLAKIALNIKGQISILCDHAGEEDNLFKRAIGMLKDPMPNVAIAACSCLLKISRLYIGANALLEEQVSHQLVDIVTSNAQNLVMKTEAAATLLQIFRFFPDAPRPDAQPWIKEINGSTDIKYTTILLELLDIWEQQLPSSDISETMQQHVKGLQVTNFDDRAQATAYLQSTLVQKPCLIFEMVAADAVPILLNNALHSHHEELARLSTSVIAMIADSNVGAQCILRYRIVEWALSQLQSNLVSTLQLMYTLRLLQVISQRVSTCKVFYERNGVEVLLSFLFRAIVEADFVALTAPTLLVLKYALHSLPSVTSALRKRSSDLYELSVKSRKLGEEHVFDVDEDFMTLIADILEKIEDTEYIEGQIMTLQDKFSKGEYAKKRVEMRSASGDLGVLDVETLTWRVNVKYTPPLTVKFSSETVPVKDDVGTGDGGGGGDASRACAGSGADSLADSVVTLEAAYSMDSATAVGPTKSRPDIGPDSFEDF